MGKDRRILIAIVLLGLVALCASGDRAHAVSAVQTSTVTSGQVPTATQWNTYLNRAENWINSNLLGSGTTFTFAEGESLLVNGTIVIDSIRVTGFFDLAAHIIPRVSRLYKIGLPTRLLAAIYSDTVDGQHVAADSLTATIITGRTTTSGFGLFPVTTGTDTLGRPTKRFQAVHADTGRFVSLGDTVTKVGSAFSLEPNTNSTATIGVNGKKFDSGNFDTVRVSIVPTPVNFSDTLYTVTPSATAPSSQVATVGYVEQTAGIVDINYYFRNTFSGLTSDTAAVTPPLKYYQTALTTSTGAVTTDTSAVTGAGSTVAIAGFVAPETYPSLEINTGNINAHIHAARTGGAGTNPTMYATFFERVSNDSMYVIGTTAAQTVTNTIAAFDLYYFLSEARSIRTGSRIACIFYMNSNAANTTITLYKEGTYSTHMGMPTSSAGLSRIFARRDTATIDSLRVRALRADTIHSAALTTNTFTLTPINNSNGRIGSNGKRYASVNADTVRHTVLFDSTDYKDASTSGDDLAPLLSGQKTWTGTQTLTVAPRLPDTSFVYANDTNTGGLVRLGPDSSMVLIAGGGKVKFGAGGVPLTIFEATNVASQLRIQNTETNGDVYVDLVNDAQTWRLQIGAASADALFFRDVTGGANRIIISTAGNVTPGADKTQNLGSLSAAWDSVIADDLVNVADMPFFDDRDDVLAIKKIRKSGEVDSLSGYKVVADSTLPKEIMVLYRKAGTHKEIVGADTVLVPHAEGDYVKDIRGKGFYAVRNAFGLLFGAVKQLDRERSDLSAWVLALQDSLRMERARIDAVLVRLHALDGQ